MMSGAGLQGARVNPQFIDLDSPIKPRPPGCQIPLTSSQARMWNRSLEADGRRPSLRMCASAVRIVGPLSLELLQRSIGIVVRRHEALRTRIVLNSGSPYQCIQPAPTCVLSVIDLSVQSSRGHCEVSHLAQEFIDTPIDLAIGPLFEAKVWKLSGDEHVLILLIDHIVSDGVSNGILTREVWECCRQGMLGRLDPVNLREIPVQFPDYAIWQAETRLAWMEKRAGYWRQHLRGVGPTMIPEDQNPPNRKPSTGITKHIRFGDELTVALRGAARRERALLSILVLTAYAVVLSAWCRTEDLLLGFASHGRHQLALHDVVGLLANTLFLRIHVQGEQTFCELLAQVKREIATALEHRDFDRVPDLLPEVATEVGFNWQATHSKHGPLDHHVMLECADQLSRFELGSGTEAKESHTADRLRFLPFPARSPGSSKFVPLFFDTPSALYMTVTFDPNILAPLTIEKFTRHLLTIAEEICQNTASCVASLLGRIGVD
jgi:hypothetical protein